MPLLSGQQLFRVHRAFREAFINEGRGLSVREFARAVVSALPPGSAAGIGPEGVAAEIMELFEAIDINGDGFLEWEEFVTFVVERGMSAGMAKLPSPKVSFRFAPELKDLITRKAASGIAFFGRLDGVLGSGERPPSKALEGFFHCEEHGREVRILDPFLRPLRIASIDDGLRLRRGSDTVEVGFVEFAPEPALLIVLLTDHSIAIWSWNSKQLAYTGRIGRTEYSLTLVRYVPAVRKLVAATTSGELLLFDPSSKAHLGTITAHPRSPIHEAIALRGMDEPCLLTAAVDRSLAIWDLETERKRVQLHTQNKLIRRCKWHSPTWRVYGMTSGSAHHEVLVWDAQSPQPLARIEGHTRDVVDVGFLRVLETDRVLTCDARCEFRMWDVTDVELGTVRPMLVFAADTISPLVPSSFTVMAGTRDIVVAGRRLARFRFSTEASAPKPAASLFQPATLRFLTLINTSLTCWEGSTGAKLAEFPACLPSECSTACWDDRKRKIIAGMASGHLAVVNPDAGVIMKLTAAGDGHTEPVAAVAFVAAGCRCVVSASNDMTVHVYDESHMKQIPLLRRITAATLAEPTAMAVGSATSQIAVGDASGLLRLIDFETLTLCSSLGCWAAAKRALEGTHTCPVNPSPSAAVAMAAFVGGQPLVAVLCGASVQLWTTRGCVGGRQPGQLLCCWSHTRKVPRYVLSDDAMKIMTKKAAFPPVRDDPGSRPATSGDGQQGQRWAWKNAAMTHAQRGREYARMTAEIAKGERRAIMASLPRGKPLGDFLSQMPPGHKLKLRRCAAARPTISNAQRRWWEHPSHRRDAGVARIVSQIVARNRALTFGLPTASDSDSDQHDRSGTPEEVPVPPSQQTGSARKGPAAVLYFASKATVEEHAARPESQGFALKSTTMALNFTAATVRGSGWRDEAAMPASPRAGHSEPGEHASEDAHLASLPVVGSSGRSAGDDIAGGASRGASSCSPRGAPPGAAFEIIAGCSDGVLVVVSIDSVVRAARQPPIPPQLRRAACANYNPLALESSCYKGRRGAQEPTMRHILETRPHEVSQSVIERGASDLELLLSATTPAQRSRRVGGAQQEHSAEDDKASAAQRASAPQPVVCLSSVEASDTVTHHIVVAGLDEGRVVVTNDSGTLLGELDRPHHVDLADAEGTEGMKRTAWGVRIDTDHERRERETKAVASIGRFEWDSDSSPLRATGTSFFLTDGGESGDMQPSPHTAASPRPSSDQTSNGAASDTAPLPATATATAMPLPRAPLPPPARDEASSPSRARLGASARRVLISRTQEARTKPADRAMSLQEQRAAQLPIVSGDDAHTWSALQELANGSAGATTLAKDEPLGDWLRRPGLALTALDRIKLLTDLKQASNKLPPPPGQLLEAARSLERMGVPAAASRTPQAAAQAGYAVLPAIKSPRVSTHPTGPRKGQEAASPFPRPSTSPVARAARQRAVMAFNIAAARMDIHEALSGGVPSTTKQEPGFLRLTHGVPRRLQESYAHFNSECDRFAARRPGRALRAAREEAVAAESALSPFLRSRIGRKELRAQPRRGPRASPAASPIQHLERNDRPITERTLGAPGSDEDAAAHSGEHGVQGPAGMRPGVRDALLAAAKDRSSDLYAVIADIAPLASVSTDAAAAGRDVSQRLPPRSIRAILRERRRASKLAQRRHRFISVTSHSTAKSSEESIPARFGPYSTLEVIRARQMFDSVDVDGSGTVELAELMSNPDWRAAYGQDRLHAIFEAMDQDRSGDVTLEELFSIMFPLANVVMIKRMVHVTATHKRVQIRSQRDVEGISTRATEAQRAEIRAVFAAIDKDGDGELSMSEIVEAFGTHAETVRRIFGQAALQSVMSKYDADDTRGLDLDEFTQLMEDVWLSKPRAQAATPDDG